MEDKLHRLYILMHYNFQNLFGAPPGKKVALFVDDVHTPTPDPFGKQPPVEFLRQLLELGGFYDSKKLFWKEVQV